MAMRLAADLGGTKTLLGLFEPSGARPSAVQVDEFATLAHDGLPAMISEFLARCGVSPRAVRAACVGAAGLVRGDTVDLTNVPWHVEAGAVRAALGGAPVALLNDVEAMAWALGALTDDELMPLQEGHRAPAGNAALLTLGTGLGHAILHDTGGRLVPLPSEGGHADFAARTEREVGLLRYLRERFGRVDVERVVSGPGLANVARFVHEGDCPTIPPGTEVVDIPAEVSRAALDGRCPRCRDAMNLWLEAFGSAAGNFAIVSVARGGVYIGGGIPPKILPALRAGGFIRAFRDKAPMEELVTGIPVRVILNSRAGLLGAAVHAATL